MTSFLKTSSQSRLILLALGLLLFFAGWTLFSARTEMVTYNSKYSIFFKNYQEKGVLAHYFFPAYNFSLTHPPSEPYVSKSPLVPLLMFGAASVLGDRPFTYYGVILFFHLLFFSLLTFFAYRRWGTSAAAWVLLFSVLNRYSFQYGDQQTPELLGVIGSMSAVFLYFEWLKTPKRSLFILSAAAYLVGFAADYCAFFAGLAICIHWLFLGRKKVTESFRTISVFPLITLLYAGLMLFLMAQARIPMNALLGRAVSRASLGLGGELPKAFLEYHFELFGPVMILSAVGFFVWLHRRNKTPYTVSDLSLLYCLLASGLLFIFAFGGAYINHRFFVMYLFPFFSIAAALGVHTLVRGLQKSRFRLFLIPGLLIIILGTTFYDNFRLPRLQHRLSLAPAPPLSKNEKVLQMARRIKSSLRPEDKLLVLTQEPSSLLKVTAFHALRIPAADASKSSWEKAVGSRQYSIVLATLPEAVSWLQKRHPEASVLAKDNEIALFRFKHDPE